MFETVLNLQIEHPWLFYPCIFIFGTVIGSFLNVCIYRIPKEKSIIRPRSHCLSCTAPIVWYDNIPILSWFILKGRCRCCNKPISFRYVVIETLTAILFVLCWKLLPTQEAIIGMFFISLLIAASFIDLDHMILPDRFTIGGFIMGVLFSFLVPSLQGYETEGLYLLNGTRAVIVALISAFLATGFLLWTALVGEIILRKEAMGFGDIKFIGCIGAFCGWQGGVFSILAGALLGTIISFPIIASQYFSKSKRPKKLDENGEEIPWNVIPFGPFLGLGALLYYLFFRDLVDEYFQTLKMLLF